MAFAAVAAYQDEAGSSRGSHFSSPQAPVQPEEKRCYTRGEVSVHKKSNDCWIVVEGKVYDVSGWLDKHPGGKRIIRHYAGEDATVSMRSLIMMQTSLL